MHAHNRWAKKHYRLRPRPSLTLDSQLCFALYTASLAMTKAYKAALERFDLTYPQYLAMLVLWEHDELSVKDLAARLALDSATLTPILKRLETVGYVRRVRGVLDERLVLIHLTETGRELKLNAAFLPNHICEIAGRPVSDPPASARRIARSQGFTRGPHADVDAGGRAGAPQIAVLSGENRLTSDRDTKQQSVPSHEAVPRPCGTTTDRYRVRRCGPATDSATSAPVLVPHRHRRYESHAHPRPHGLLDTFDAGQFIGDAHHHALTRKSPLDRLPHARPDLTQHDRIIRELVEPHLPLRPREASGWPTGTTATISSSRQRWTDVPAGRLSPTVPSIKAISSSGSAASTSALFP